MSDREFDTYLTLLASLLKLDRRQRGKIAEELRAHLEDRLEELLAEGVPREEAIRQALAEFGDAAGLAAEFKTLSWNRKRRWLMRATTFSVAATLLLAAGIVTFWPGRNAGPGIAQLGAQDVEEKVGEPENKPSTDRSKSLEELLNERGDFSYVKTPLNDVVEHLTSTTGVQFVLNSKRLEEAGLGTDTPVSRSLHGVRLSTFLDLLLSDLQLTYVEKEGELLLIITTPEDAEATMLIRVYDCRDLLSMPWPDGAQRQTSGGGSAGGFGGGSSPFGGGGGTNQPKEKAKQPATGDSDAGGIRVPDGIVPQFGDGSGFGGGMGQGRPQREPTEHERRVEALVGLIETNVDPHTWEVQGGPGSISEFGGLVVVTQTAKTHKKVERVLDMLRQAAGLESPLPWAAAWCGKSASAAPTHGLLCGGKSSLEICHGYCVSAQDNCSRCAAQIEFQNHRARIGTVRGGE
jgi:hypothetical protein